MATIQSSLIPSFPIMYNRILYYILKYPCPISQHKIGPTPRSTNALNHLEGSVPRCGKALKYWRINLYSMMALYYVK